MVAGGTTPDPVLIFLEIGDIGEPTISNAILCLALGETIRAFRWRGGIIRIARGGDRWIVALW